ncbi:MAG: hypothetical protein ACOYL6_00700 [Bacteriovoracaceae bacterium]
MQPILVFLITLFANSVFGGELQSVVATYLCGTVKVGFAVSPKTKELIAYYHNSKSVGVMPTSLKMDQSFDLKSHSILMNDSVCLYQFQNETITSSNCEVKNQFIPSGLCKKL